MDIEPLVAMATTHVTEGGDVGVGAQGCSAVRAAVRTGP